MRSFSVFFGMLAASSVVLAESFPSHEIPFPKVNAQIMRRQSNSTNTTAAAEQLASSIGFNIMTQQGEIAAAEAYQQLQQAGLQDPVFLAAAKTNLKTFIEAGIGIRVQSQMLAKINFQVARGLAQVEESQVIEVALMNNLTGNPMADGPILQQLLARFQQGMKANMGLQSLATAGSQVPQARATSVSMT